MADFTSFGVSEVTRGDIVYTAHAIEEISAGQLVRGSASSADVVTSAGVSSLAKGDIRVAVCDANTDASFCVGIALEDMASGSYGSIGTRGLYLIRAGEGLGPGAPVQAPEDTAHANSSNVIEAAEGYAHCIGRALTSASAAEKFVVVLLNI